MRAERIALAALAAGHTVAWTCDATTLPRRAVHRLAEQAGMAWHQESDTFRRPNSAGIRRDVAQLVDELAALLDDVDDARERRAIRREAALIFQRIDRALYTPAPTAPAAPKRRRAPHRKAKRQ